MTIQSKGIKPICTYNEKRFQRAINRTVEVLSVHGIEAPRGQRSKMRRQLAMLWSEVMVQELLEQRQLSVEWTNTSECQTKPVNSPPDSRYQGDDVPS